ncbi:putative fatty acyl-CoA reductase-like protein [Leptotrombidium deliense]|uniref:Fatty acyl-CoA reductase n=1 Tax=Leptotrombidium deliense TaxID=299467 RepID=A0A443SM07_9ACAR|nr:putative fatty acyl-CoA reductase-like protein [Leptotrombidium deliense]
MQRDLTPIQSFYKGKNIFITGATGVCGRILLEKILRSLLDIGTIFLIIRSKRDLNGAQRIQKLLQTPLFKLNPPKKSQVQKIVVIEGDVTDGGLSMSSEDELRLINSVDIIFHVAASTFKSLLNYRENFNSNVVGTENVLEFAKKVKNLKCFVHVSTAYSNCQLSCIDETLYPLSSNVHTMVEKFKSLDDKNLEIEGVKHFDGRPNNYTFTKAIAEHVVHSYFPSLPVVIARPAVVIPAAKEPAPGFFDTLEGPTGLAIVASLGILKVWDWDLNNRYENYPVDYLANSLIAIAYDSQKKSKEMKIFNLVASPLNDYDNDYDAIKSGREYWLTRPSIYTLRYPIMPDRICTMSNTEYKIKRFFYHTVFAFFLDLILMILGRKRMMMRVVRKMHSALDVMKYFSNKQWTFKCENYKKLIDELDAKDEEIFSIDISKVNFTQLYQDSSRIARKMILHEDESNIPIAKMKLKM